MDYIQTAIDILQDTEVGRALEAVRDFYDSVQPDFDSFTEETGVKCQVGCGECCAHFIPDVTASEALIIAVAILFGKRKSELQERLKGVVLSKIACPFYDFWSDHHCMIYNERPLVCRMFNSCLSEGKNGEMEFRDCRFNGNASPLDISSLSSSFKPMNDYGEMLESLEGNSTETELLPAAVEREMNRVGNILACLFSDSATLTPVKTEA